MIVKKNKKNALISESYIGNHSNIEYFNADLFSLTFAPNITINTKEFGLKNASIPERFLGIWFNGINILKKWQKINICQELKSLNYDIYIIGTDNDYEGNAMAKLLQLNLIKEGVSPQKIIRVPLDYNGYTKVIPFWDNETLINYLVDKQEDTIYLNYSKQVTKGKGGVGRRIAYMLSELLEPPEFVDNINPSGTSTITYLFKKEINEK